MTDSETKMPFESYQFQFTKDELKSIHRQRILADNRRGLLFVAGMLGLLLYGIIQTAPAYCLTAAVCLVIFIIVRICQGWFTAYRQLKQSEDIISQTTYVYKLFDDRFCMELYRDGALVRDMSFHYTDLTSRQLLGEWLILSLGEHACYLRKRDLPAHSFLLRWFPTTSPAKQPIKAEGGWYIASVALVIASLLTLPVGLRLIAEVASPTPAMTESMWLFFLLTPVPLASIVFGFVLKKKGYFYKKNVITGIILTALLCIYGSFTFLFGNLYDHSDAAVVQVEQEIGIDLPTPASVVTQKIENQTGTTGMRFFSAVDFTEEAVANFETQLKNDDRWLTTVPSQLECVIPPFAIYGGENARLLLYNADTRQFNELPEKSGTYRFISLVYNSEHNQLQIVEHVMEYIAA